MATKLAVPIEAATVAPEAAPVKDAVSKDSTTEGKRPRQRSQERPKRSRSVDPNGRRRASLESGDQQSLTEANLGAAERRRGSDTSSHASEISDFYGKLSRRHSNASNVSIPADPEVIKIIQQSWAEASARGTDEEGKGKGKGNGDSQEGVNQGSNFGSKSQTLDSAIAKKESQKKGWFGSMRGSKTEGYVETKEGETQQSAGPSKAGPSDAFVVPKTFKDMMKLNAGMVGANMPYIELMLEDWDAFMKNIMKTGMSAEYADILATRFHRELPGGGKDLKLGEFKMCLLASLRSLLPGMWDSKHEHAWIWLCETLEDSLKISMPHPAMYERQVRNFLTSLNEKQINDIGLNAWKRMFKKDPKAEQMFRQSNGRLIFIAVTALQLSRQFYDAPQQVYMQVQQLGIRHVYNQVQPKYFPRFVECMDEELKDWTEDKQAIDGINWTLSIIAMTLCRYVIEGGLLKVK